MSQPLPVQAYLKPLASELFNLDEIDNSVEMCHSSTPRTNSAVATAANGNQNSHVNVTTVYNLILEMLDAHDEHHAKSTGTLTMVALILLGIVIFIIVIATKKFFKRKVREQARQIALQA